MDAPFAMLRLQRENLLLTVAQSSAKLVRARRWRQAMDEVLGDVATAAHVDRAWLFRIFRRDGGEPRWSIWHEWGAAGTGFTSLRRDPSFTDQPIRGPRHDNTLSFNEMRMGRVFYCTDIRELPAMNRQLAERFGIRSMVRAPIMRQGRLWGAIGFDSVRQPRSWTDAEQQVLVALATVVGAVLDRDASVNVLWDEQTLGVPPALQALAAAAVARLHRADQIDEGLDGALELLANGLQAERAWTTELRHHAGGSLDSGVVREWHRPTAQPLSRTPLRAAAAGELAQWYQTLYDGRALQVGAQAAHPGERAALSAYGLAHMACVPIAGLTRRWQGTLCLSRPQAPALSTAELQVLETVADAVHAARDRRLEPV